MAENLNLENIQWLTLHGSEIEKYINQLGALRIQVFKDWPYLYEGDLQYEQNYLKRYAQAQKSIAVLVFDKQQLVGATTAIDLQEEDPQFQTPFKGTEFQTEQAVYFAESILLPEYRGLGWGKRFMEERLKFAKSLPGKTWVTFCSVVRPGTHPLKPKNYRPLNEFWKSWGFQEAPGILAQYHWKDLGEKEESTKELQFWYKKM